MQIATTKALSNGRYSVVIALRDDGLSLAEQEAISQFGEPVIDCGGSFDDQAGLTYTLATNEKLFPSQFPVKELFSTEDFPSDASARADLWKSTVIARLTSAVQTLRTNSVGALGYDVQNIDTTPA